MQQQAEIRKVAAKTGWQWLLGGGDLFARQISRLLVLGLALQVLLSLVQLPFLGPFVVLLMPALAAGVLWAVQEADGGRPAALGYLFSGLRSSRARGPLLLLGAINLLLVMLSAFWLLEEFKAVYELNIIERIANQDASVINPETERLLRRLLGKGLLSFALVGLLNYFTVPLILFSGFNTIAAIKASIQACFRNWAAFLVFSLGIVVVVMGGGLILLLLGGLLGALLSTATLFTLIYSGFVLVCLVALQMILQCARYRAYQSIFQQPEKDTQPTSDSDDQIVA